MPQLQFSGEDANGVAITFMYGGPTILSNTNPSCIMQFNDRLI